MTSPDPKDLEQQLAVTTALYEQAARKYGDAIKSRNEAICEATAAGYTRRELAALFGISAGRVQQILGDSQR